MPRSFRYALLWCMALFCLGLRAPVQATALNGYDAAQVGTHITMLAETIGSRAAGTVQELQAAEYLVEQFDSYGYTTTVQPFPYNGAASQNVIATWPGLDPTSGTVYIGAHYDSVPNGPGANDNASGAAVLLELARLFSAEPMSQTLTLIAFGAEEPGMIGSRAFVEQLDSEQRDQALGMINLDCVGVGDRLRLATIWHSDRTRNERTLRIAQQQAAALGLQPMTSIKGDSDHEPFALAGIPSVVVFADVGGMPCGPDYHQPTDTAEKLDPELMAQIARLVDATSRELLRSVRPTFRVRFPLVNQSLAQAPPYP